MSTALVKKQADLKETLQKAAEEQLAAVATSLIKPERLVRAALVAATRNPDLLDCTKKSWVSALMDAAALGLDVSGVTGDAYLVPYKKTATLIPGYRGLRNIAYRSGLVEMIHCQVVRENDEFELDLGAEPKLSHKPAPGDRGEKIGAYMVAHLKGARVPLVEWMDREQIEAIKKRSKASKSGPWVTDEDEMWRKSVSRRGCKQLPSSPDLEWALAMDAQAERTVERKGVAIGDLVLEPLPEDEAQKKAPPKGEPAEPKEDPKEEETVPGELLSDDAMRRLEAARKSAGIDSNEWSSLVSRFGGAELLVDVPAEKEELLMLAIKKVAAAQ